MCLQPFVIRNKRFIPNKKNNYNPPVAKDDRIKWIEIPCGVCYECLKRKKSDWQVRLINELKFNADKCYFITLTFSDDAINNLAKKYKIDIVKGFSENIIATKSIRLFLERIRHYFKKSFKHFFITELGEANDRIHLHGFIWLPGNVTIDDLVGCWSYGHYFVGQWVNNTTIGYITKYILKFDSSKFFMPKILCSKGIGKSANYNIKFEGELTKKFIKLDNGYKVAIPNYYKNKLFSESEREELFINSLNSNEFYVMGNKIERKDFNEIYRTRDFYNNLLNISGYNSKEYLKINKLRLKKYQKNK